MSSSSLKGQLGVKSSPLAPTSAKLTTQMLVISHMENHYKKINKAKPAIDNRPPKSMVSSQKMRDRRSRKQIERHGSRPSSRLTYRTNSVEEDIYDEDQWDEPEDDDERQVRDIMRTTLRGPLKAKHGIVNITSALADDDDDDPKDERSALGMTLTRPQSATLKRVVQRNALMGRTRPVSARSTTSLASQCSQASRSTNPAKVTYDGDVLNKHAHSFTEPTKPFTPRTLKSNRQSSLKTYKYYTAPPTKSQSSLNQRQEEEGGDRATPQVKPRMRSGKGVKDLDATQTLTETMLMDMSLQSHHHRQGQGESGVPRLDISLDKDHLDWVKDQASRVQRSDEVVA